LYCPHHHAKVLLQTDAHSLFCTRRKNNCISGLHGEYGVGGQQLSTVVSRSDYCFDLRGSIMNLEGAEIYALSTNMQLTPGYVLR
jgi:hypothetical protein